jgi:hypothetical protein
MASRFELRPMRYIIAAYFLAPIAGTAMLGLVPVVWSAFTRPTAVGGLMLGWFALTAFGLVFGLFVELIVVTPILIGFRRWRWRWLNGWTGVGLGFLTIAVPMFVLTILSPTTGTLLANNGDRAAQAWGYAFGGSVIFGVAGALSAWVFRLIAVRMAPTAASVASAFD